MKENIIKTRLSIHRVPVKNNGSCRQLSACNHHLSKPRSHAEHGNELGGYFFLVRL